MAENSKMKYKLKCLVVDDEPIAIEGIADFIDKVEFLELVGKSYSAMEAASFIKDYDVDMLFLDINMPYLSGLEFLETLKQPPLTIITTAYSEYAIEGYRLQVLDYLLKPIPFNRFYQAATKAYKIFEMERHSRLVTEENKAEVMFIRQGDSFEKITSEEILYIEGMQNYAKLFFKNNSVRVIHQTLISLEELLPKSNFFRVHKSFIININFIESLQGNRVFIGKKEIPVSRLKKEDLLQNIIYKNLISK